MRWTKKVERSVAEVMKLKELELGALRDQVTPAMLISPGSKT